jgi:hypothetical protein
MSMDGSFGSRTRQRGHWRNDRRGKRFERIAATRRGKPLKAEAHGRYQHETRLARIRTEQDVKRLRKPEDVAQSGEANSVWVAV